MIYDYDEKDGILKVDDKTVYFTEKENNVFKLLYKKELVKYDKINETLNDGYCFNTSYSIKTFISRLRDKIGDSIEINNIRGKGYIMKI